MAVEGARTSERDFRGDTHVLNAFAFRLRASVVPFDAGGGAARHASALAQLQASRWRADLARTSLEEQVRRLWAFQSERSARLSALADLVVRADAARDVVYQQFRIGRRSILDVLSYDLERFNTRAQLVNERYDIALTRFQLIGALGRLYPVVAGGENLAGGRGNG